MTQVSAQAHPRLSGFASSAQLAALLSVLAVAALLLLRQHLLRGAKGRIATGMNA